MLKGVQFQLLKSGLFCRFVSTSQKFKRVSNLKEEKTAKKKTSLISLPSWPAPRRSLKSFDERSNQSQEFFELSDKKDLRSQMGKKGLKHQIRVLKDDVMSSVVR